MKIPTGYELYTGPRTWKFIKGAKYWDIGDLKWAQVDGGAYTTGDGPIIIRKKKSITAYCATQCGEPTFCALAYRRSKTLARVREIWGKDYRKTHPDLKIMKVIITEA